MTIVPQSVKKITRPSLPAIHPSVARDARRRADDVQLRIADAITRFAGSMAFVYLHIIGFTAWMVVAEKSPWPTLTLIVSLEAIFLSTFVMIGQNRQSAFQQDKANHDFIAQEHQLDYNTELTRAIHHMATEIYAAVAPAGAKPDVAAPNAGPPAGTSDATPG
ncbi:MAG: DUF1003 domain-containing protein [Frankia sp.]